MYAPAEHSENKSFTSACCRAHEATSLPMYTLPLLCSWQISLPCNGVDVCDVVPVVDVVGVEVCVDDGVVLVVLVGVVVCDVVVGVVVVGDVVGVVFGVVVGVVRSHSANVPCWYSVRAAFKTFTEPAQSSSVPVPAM